MAGFSVRSLAEVGEGVDVAEIEKGLKVEVQPGRGANIGTTEMVVRPPMTMGEYREVRESVGGVSMLGFALAEPPTRSYDHSLLSFPDRIDETYANIGVELAEELITTRGLKGGVVVYRGGEKPQTQVVLPA